ncbi:MAG TPA: hypothetical protein DDX92_05270 [Flavobacteriales bacterium]|jgi:hypothetical protein|nr:hypothetical protein [Flavobacteriales bacterium]
MKKVLLLTLSVFFLLTTGFSQAIKVEVRETEDGYSLYRDGKPYYIKGAGGKTQIDQLIYLGGNSIRTWGVDEADEALELAAKHDLTVMLGLWVQHERHGFDYNDEAAVQKQLENFTQVVMKYKDHPNLLLWGIGNEVDLFYSNTKVWDAIQDIAAMVHRLDPNHPTSTVTAGIDSMEVQEVMRRAPDIDIYGINTYGDIGKVPDQIKRYGWEGPYIISEWGPNGHWEVPSTTWGAPVEQTSTEKAASYRMRYQDYIAANKGKCIGSYVFLWGQKQETTSTWYGLFTQEGDPTEPLDELYKAWREVDSVPNYSPSISSLTLDSRTANDNIRLKSGDSYLANVSYSDRDGDRLSIKWLIYPESSDTKAGGDFESAIQPILGTFRSRKKESAEIVAPETEGGYRLFVFIQDSGKRTAYANIPFYVEPRTKDDPPAKAIRFKKQELQLTPNP